MERTNYASGAKWEDLVGYSRAVKVGNQLEVSGTVAVDDNGTVGLGDAYEQTRYILSKIKGVLEKADFTMEDVVRTRMYVTDIGLWEAVGRAHREYFGVTRPATSMVEVKGLIHPDYLVEVEVTALKAG